MTRRLPDMGSPVLFDRSGHANLPEQQNQQNQGNRNSDEPKKNRHVLFLSS
jgi:hypothetical protein